ncbi:MAG: DUF455 family protein, partial [Comamonadaceae bacterium]
AQDHVQDVDRPRGRRRAHRAQLVLDLRRDIEAARAVDILDVILRDEVGHVAIGNHWYRWLCERDGLDPVALYPQLVERHQAPRLHPPFNVEARGRAGFTADELAALAAR